MNFELTIDWYHLPPLGLSLLSSIYLKVITIFRELWYLALFLGMIMWQGAVLAIENRDKRKKYKAANAYASMKGKPLLVTGGPFGINRIRRFLKIPAHGQGDVCLDIDSRALYKCSCPVVADVRYLPFPDKTFGAIFVSHLLEHLPNIAEAKKALAEFNRVAEAVFIVYPYRQSLISWLIPSHRLWIWQKKGAVYLQQRKHWGNKHMEKIFI